MSNLVKNTLLLISPPFLKKGLAIEFFASKNKDDKDYVK